MERTRVAVVTTTCREVLRDCLVHIDSQVDRIIVVHHRCELPSWLDEIATPITSIPYPPEVPNISEMWNIGLNSAEDGTTGSYDVAVLNDDALVPEGWFSAVTTAMRETGCVAGSTDQTGRIDSATVYLEPEPIDLDLRLSGFAYILDGDAKLRLDEQFQWWYGDDDLDWQARQSGGVVKVPGFPVTHLYPNGTTNGLLAEIAGRDRQRFEVKWGRPPH